MHESQRSIYIFLQSSNVVLIRRIRFILLSTQAYMNEKQTITKQWRDKLSSFTLLSSCDLLVRLDTFYGTCFTSTFGSTVQKLAFFRLNLILTTHFVSLQGVLRERLLTLTSSFYRNRSFIPCVKMKKKMSGPFRDFAYKKEITLSILIPVSFLQPNYIKNLLLLFLITFQHDPECCAVTLDLSPYSVLAISQKTVHF